MSFTYTSFIHLLICLSTFVNEFFSYFKIDTPSQVYSHKTTQENRIQYKATFYFILQIDYASQYNLRGNTYVFLVFTKTNIPLP